MAKSSLLLGRTLRCMVHFVPYYNKNKSMICILSDSLRGATGVEPVLLYGSVSWTLTISGKENRRSIH